MLVDDFVNVNNYNTRVSKFNTRDQSKGHLLAGIVSAILTSVVSQLKVALILL